MNIPPQLFEVSDIPVIGMLILLEGLLSADNALVLAIMVRHLPEKLRGKALIYGLGGAFVFRAAAILLASIIMNAWWLQVIGAGYLIFITAKHFLSRNSHEAEKEVGHKADVAGFWKTVILVEVADIAFAVDSVLAAVALVQSDDPVHFKSKLWVIYAGAIIGVILLRYAAKVFLKLLDRFPALEHLAYALVGWAGVKLFVMAGYHFTESVDVGFHIPHMTPLVFWSVLALILVVGIAYAVKHPNPNPDEVPDAIKEDFEVSDVASAADE